MKMIEGRKYYLQGDVLAVVGKSPPVVKRMVDQGEIEPPVAKIGKANLWNAKQYERIKRQFGSAA